MAWSVDGTGRLIFIQITFRRTYVRNPPHNCIAQASIHSPNIDLHLLPTPLIFGAGLGSLQNWYADGVPTDLLGKHTQPKPPSGPTQPPGQPSLAQPGTGQPAQPEPSYFFVCSSNKVNEQKHGALLFSTHTQPVIWRNFLSWKIDEIPAAPLLF